MLHGQNITHSCKALNISVKGCTIINSRQYVMKQDRLLPLVPSHSGPPFCGAGLVQVRLRIWVPSNPHVALHLLHSNQLLQPPGIAGMQKIEYFWNRIWKKWNCKARQRDLFYRRKLANWEVNWSMIIYSTVGFERLLDNQDRSGMIYYPTPDTSKCVCVMFGEWCGKWNMCTSLIF